MTESPFGDYVMGARSSLACELLIEGHPFEFTTDLLFAAGMKPRHVAFCPPQTDTAYLDDVEAFYKPKLLIKSDWLKRLKSETFISCLKDFKTSCASAGIQLEPLEEGSHEWIQT
jgi:hypothetical protein